MNKILTAVLLMAVVTYIPRVLSIAVFKNKLRSRFIRSSLYYVPFAALGAMTFPGIFITPGIYTLRLLAWQQRWFWPILKRGC